MIDNWNALDRMDHAERETPFCVCGQPMAPVSRPDGIWLECTSVTRGDDRRNGRIGRIVSAITASAHTQQLIIEMVDAAA